MIKSLFTYEQAKRLADDHARMTRSCYESQLAHENTRYDFMRGLAAAEAEFRKRMEEAPVVYGPTQILGGTAAWLETETSPFLEKQGRVMNIEPIEKEEPSDDQP